MREMVAVERFVSFILSLGRKELKYPIKRIILSTSLDRLVNPLAPYAQLFVGLTDSDIIFNNDV